MGSSDEGADRRAAEREMMIAEFLNNLTHERPEYRWGAADALGRIGDERVVEPLIAAMKDPDPRVRKKRRGRSVRSAISGVSARFWKRSGTKTTMSGRSPGRRMRS